jgi:hypothetical protein
MASTIGTILHLHRRFERRGDDVSRPFLGRDSYDESPELFSSLPHSSTPSPRQASAAGQQQPAGGAHECFRPHPPSLLRTLLLSSVVTLFGLSLFIPFTLGMRSASSWTFVSLWEDGSFPVHSPEASSFPLSPPHSNMEYAMRCGGMRIEWPRLSFLHASARMYNSPLHVCFHCD